MIRVSAAPAVDLFTADTMKPGKRTLLVIHGGPDWDHSYLREPLSQLCEVHRVVLPDLRGCGRSTSGLGDSQYTPDAVVRDLIALIDELNAGPLAVLGFSYGGLIAQRLAVTAPDRVDRLIIASSSVLCVEAGAYGDWPERDERLARAAAGWADPTLCGADLVRHAAVAGAGANVWRDDAVPKYLDRIARVRFSAEWLRPWQAGILPSPRLADPVGQLNATGNPILLLPGRQDMTFPLSLAERAAALLPAARLVVVDEAGHMAHIDQPAAWLAAITDFLA